MTDKRPPSRDWFDVLTRSAKEWVTHAIALGIVATSLLLIARELWNPVEGKLEVAQGIASIVGPWVGVVIGFYFGTRSGERQAEAASAQADVKVGRTASAVEDLAEAKTNEITDALERIAGIETKLKDVIDQI